MSIQASVRLARQSFDLEVDLEVEGGSTLAVLGPNGAGKSTLLRAIAGLERIDHGSIRLDDQVVDDGSSQFTPAHARGIGMVFQDYALFWHLNILGNVAFGPQAKGMDRRSALELAQGVLDRFGIGDLAQRRPSQVSGGQAQRAALARALAPEPTNLLLDEPLAALDIETRQSVRLDLQAHLAAFPGSTILVTHDPLDAMILADQVVVLESGRIVQRGTPADLAQRPATAYVAALMGVNLLTGTASDGTLHVDAGGTLRIADHDLAGPCLATIRPESITVTMDRPEHPGTCWPGTVTALETLHDRVRLHLAGEPGLTASVTHAAVAGLRLRPGTEVWISVAIEDVEAYSPKVD